MKLYEATTIVALLLAISTIAAGDVEEATSTKQTINEAHGEPVSEPTVKLVHVLNPGEREYLSPNLIGVQNIAMTFLPLSMNFVNIIDAYREIVNGVRYEILLNAVDTKAKDADIICRQVILEKPWLTTQWGDKFRELVTSNCTDGAADNQLSDEKYVSNAIFNGGQRNELSDDEMAHLEAQIMPAGGPSKRRATTAPSTTTTTTKASTTTTTTERVAINEPTTLISADEVAGTTPATADSDTNSDSNSKQANKELNDNEKQWLDDFLSVGAYNFEKSIEAATAVASLDAAAAVGSNNEEQQRESEPPQQQQQQLPLADANNYQTQVEEENVEKLKQPQAQVNQIAAEHEQGANTNQSQQEQQQQQ